MFILFILLCVEHSLLNVFVLNKDYLMSSKINAVQQMRKYNKINQNVHNLFDKQLNNM